MASTGENHTVVCRRQGQVFTFGLSSNRQLRHRHLQPEVESTDYEPIVCRMPLLVDELVGKRVVCIAARTSFKDGSGHTAVCIDTGQLYTFGLRYSGQLGHGCVYGGEWVPQLVKDIDTKVLVLMQVMGSQLYSLNQVACGPVGVVRMED